LSSDDVHRLRTRIDAYPRIELAHLPTPLEEMTPMRCIGIDVDCEPEGVREDVLRLRRQVVTRLDAYENWRDELADTMNEAVTAGDWN
jgi:1-aminocyclopropane-1-carboxylate deaminase/D-cysteine desulfhydrase-like pyridoxal-dependent ACC family enzyme